MTPEEEETTPNAVQPEKQPSAKKPYEKPAFRFERVFVTTALSCGKVISTESTCVHNTKSS
jgi:hypothetical protein